MLVRLAHVCIETVDLESTEAFYELLGARRQFEFRNLQDELIGMYLYFGEDTFIEIVKVGQPRSSGTVAHFALEVTDVQAIREQLCEVGIEVGDVELGVDHTWMATCHDPNGVFIELHQYTDESLQKKGGMCRIDYTP